VGIWAGKLGGGGGGMCVCVCVCTYIEWLVRWDHPTQLINRHKQDLFPQRKLTPLSEQKRLPREHQK